MYVCLGEYHRSLCALQDALADKFTSKYLLKFARRELSSINLEFLIALNEMLHRLDPTGGPVRSSTGYGRRPVE